MHSCMFVGLFVAASHRRKRRRHSCERYTHVSLSLSSMSYEEEDTCMSYEEEDTACHMRRRIHACNASGCSRTPTALSVRLESCERR